MDKQLQNETRSENVIIFSFAKIASVANLYYVQGLDSDSMLYKHMKDGNEQRSFQSIALALTNLWLRWLTWGNQSRYWSKYIPRYFT